MIISHRKQFIFVHVYKVAGTSVKSALRPYADVMHRKYTPRRVLYVLGLLQSIGEHASAAQIRATLPANIFDNYFKFAFVRNPWDWQVSLYHYIRSHPLHPQHRRVKALQGFPDYVRWRIDHEPVLQKDFVTDSNGNVLVDYIGRFETLGEDFDAICRRIGVDNPLPHKNLSKHDSYVDYYDSRTAALVAEYYRPDIELFGYRFGQPTRPTTATLAF